MKRVCVEIYNYTHQSVPYSLFERIGVDMLPDKYDLSVACVGNTRARNANKKYRDKQHIPNVLSFALSNKSGEILLNASQINMEAKKNNVGAHNYMTFLFIHSLLHLLGHTHGDTMEYKENVLCKKYKIRL